MTQKREPFTANWNPSGATFSQVSQLFGFCLP